MVEDITYSSFTEKTIEKTDWNEEFTVTLDFCANLLRNERPFTRLLQRKQRPDLYNHTYYQSIEDKKYIVDTSNFDSHNIEPPKR